MTLPVASCGKPITPIGAASTGGRKSHSVKTTNAPPVPEVEGGAVTRLTVNGETINVADFWNGERAELAKQTASSSPESYGGYVAQRAATLIRDRIAEMLLYQRAKLRLTADVETRIDAYVDGEIRKIVTTSYEGREARYEKQLQTEGQTLAEARERLRRELIISGYLEAELKPKIAEPTRAELLAAFNASADSLRRAPRRRMSLIDVRVRDRLSSGIDNPTPEQWEAARTEARSRAELALAEIHKGISFADVAKKLSDGLHAEEGGSWGWVAPDSVRERFQPAVNALGSLSTGGVSGIIDAGEDFFLVRCDEVDGGHEPDFQTEQPRLRESIVRTSYNRLISELVEELRNKARIEPPDLERLHAAVAAAAPSYAELAKP